MSQILEISPETTTLIESYAAHRGVSVDEYIRSLLPTPSTDLGLAADAGEDFMSDMESFAADGERLPYAGSYSREDIYSDITVVISPGFQMLSPTRGSK